MYRLGWVIWTSPRQRPMKIVKWHIPNTQTPWICLITCQKARLREYRNSNVNFIRTAPIGSTAQASMNSYILLIWYQCESTNTRRWIVTDSTRKYLVNEQRVIITMFTSIVVRHFNSNKFLEIQSIIYTIRNISVRQSRTCSVYYTH